ncbi:Acyl-CoA thioesterase 2 [Frondihabitans sp. 762G35]|uniref:acyl-CoA thioesterase n=1 Tax=Frondihabitans sp. 762G35 TaxID=1446794 RepID=UPI000D1FFF24|nr:acyl-CoA thioesterase II [Frondihabitans sp. 762G35]ARC56432.1 Acyl-CoA thioesterase 2 [Frondihabitans sp. 762G35]
MTAHSEPGSAPDDPLADLLHVFELTPRPAGSAGRGSSAPLDVFEGPSQWQPNGRVFGGQVLAQSLIAAQRTVPDEKVAHSMHAYFLRAGKVELPIEFQVDRSHDGRSFATRRTEALQNGVPIMSTISSFQTVDSGLDHQLPMAADLPDPESLPTLAESLAGIEHPAARFWANGRPFDVRHVPSPIFVRVEGAHVAHQALWMKTIGPLPDDPALHRAALAYASDLGILEPIFRRHGLPMSTPGMKIASLDHAMWWHRPGRADEWLLYAMESPTAVGGRGLAQGRFYDRDGRLLASVAQEGMTRVPGY